MDETSLPLRIHALRAVEVAAAMRAAEALTDDSHAKVAGVRDGETVGCSQANPVGTAA